MSDVEKQIEQWRKGLQTSDAFGADDLEELESHLREEMERLTPLGLSGTEAFLVARHRLGATEALEAEYAKVNTDRRALLHLYWMAAGVLVYILAGCVALAVSHGGVLAAVLLGVGGLGVTALALAGVATKVVAGVALLAIVWACVRRSSWSRLTGRLRTMSLPVLVGLLGGLAVAACLALGFELLFRMAAARCLNAEEYGWMAQVSAYAGLGWVVLAPVLAGVLVIVLRTRADRYQPTMSPGS
jgi:hypothetical protein